MTSTYWKAGLLVSAFVGFGISLGAAQAQEQTKPTIKRVEAQPIVSVEGKDNFEAYCATCHGKEAKGNGPAAAALKVPPPDLTILARKNGGKFNSTEVEGTITGKNKMPNAHGSGDMPLWGPVFRSMSPDTNVTTLRVQNLVDYLKSIQVK